MYIYIQSLTNIDNDEIKNIIKVHNQINEYCLTEMYNIYTSSKCVFERINTASDILVLNAIRFNKNKSYTLELAGANITNKEILDILESLVMS